MHFSRFHVFVADLVAKEAVQLPPPEFVAKSLRRGQRIQRQAFFTTQR